MRWYVCGLLFFATTINYIDRQVLGLLKPVLEKDLGWTEKDYGFIVFAFQTAYAFVMPFAGRFIDWLGTRMGYMLAVVVWSFAAMAHALAGSAMQFSIARFGLGLGEAANFPAAVKTTADWFPAKERALATGIFNSGSNIGAVVAPLAVPWIAGTWGWRSAFLITGALGFLWVALWMLTYREPPRHERSEAINYWSLLRQRQAWAILLGKFLTDPVWWFYLYWFPGFLFSRYGVDLTRLGPPLIAVYVLADVGSIGGGWLSSKLLAKGWSVNSARKTAMLVCAIAVTAAVFVGQASLWGAVALVSIAAAAHQGWSANLYTLASDLYPKNSVGSVVGLSGMGGAIGGMLVAPAVGYWLDSSGKAYGPLFVVAGCMYLLALLIIHLLVPKVEPPL